VGRITFVNEGFLPLSLAVPEESKIEESYDVLLYGLF
jgi:hypothetical protein